MSLLMFTATNDVLYWEQLVQRNYNLVNVTPESRKLDIRYCTLGKNKRSHLHKLHSPPYLSPRHTDKDGYRGTDKGGGR